MSGDGVTLNEKALEAAVKRRLVNGCCSACAPHGTVETGPAGATWTDPCEHGGLRQRIEIDLRAYHRSLAEQGIRLVDVREAGIPAYAMLDVWMALGGDPAAFDRMWQEDRRTPADTWSQLLAVVRGESLDGDTNPPGGPEFARLMARFAPGAEAKPSTDLPSVADGDKPMEWNY